MLNEFYSPVTSLMYISLVLRHSCRHLVQSEIILNADVHTFLSLQSVTTEMFYLFQNSCFTTSFKKKCFYTLEEHDPFQNAAHKKGPSSN